MSTYIYARVSTFEQFHSGFSIDSQCTSGLTYAKNNLLLPGLATNCDLPGVFIDGGKSAYTKRLSQRPGGQAMMAVLKPGDTVIATATHRLFRKMSDMVTTMEYWVDNGISVVFTDYPMLSTTTANGRAMIRIFAVVAELKSDLTSARVREARMLSKDKPKEPKAAPIVYAPIENPTSKDIGSVMQAVMADRERSKFRFTGKIRAYVRCSTKDQTVEQQRLCILKQLPQDMKDSEIVWYEDEGASAFKTSLSKRKAGAKMLSDLQAGDIVVAWRPDRIFRSMLDMARMTEAIHAKGSFLMTVEGGIKTDTPFGKTVVSLLSLLAEVESQEISRSTKQGLMIAAGVNPDAQVARLPKMLGECKDTSRQKHFCFNQFFTKAERFSMHIQLTLTEKHFRDRRTACRVISNQWLKRKGLPSVTGENGNTLAAYQAKVKAMQREQFSEKRDRLLGVLQKYDKGTLVMYPLNVDTIAHVFRRQTEWIRVAKMIPGRLRDKEGLTAMVATCRDQAEAVKLMGVLK